MTGFLFSLILKFKTIYLIKIIMSKTNRTICTRNYVGMLIDVRHSNAT